MIKKRVVFIRSNPVNPDSRVEKEANCLIKNGYDVVILAWDRKSKHRIKESKIRLSNGVVKIYRFGILASYGDGIRNLKQFLKFQIRTFAWLLKNKMKYDIIHACDFDTAFTAYLCSKFFKKKLVFDIFDYLYTRIDNTIGIVGKIVVFLQHKIINYSTATIICTEERKEQIRGSRPKKLVVIHNSPPQIDFNLKKLNLNKEHIKIVYVGILQDYRFLRELSSIVKNNKNLELHIGGFGKYEKYFEELSSNYANIIYYGKISYDKTLELENSCDIITAIYDPSIGNHYYAAPNKFYEGLMLGKPLIMVKNTGMSDIVRKHNIGEVMDFSIEGLEVAIQSLIYKKEEWPEMTIRMKELYKTEYSWSEMEKRLIELYESM